MLGKSLRPFESQSFLSTRWGNWSLLIQTLRSVVMIKSEPGYETAQTKDTILFTHMDLSVTTQLV